LEHEMDIQEYLNRIKFSKTIQVDSKTLRELQLAHLKSVPFENLDIGLGRKINLDLPSLWDKIIVHQRGGFCYELNGLFAWLLKEIGFDVTYLNAMVYYGDEDRYSIEFTHLALLVKASEDERQWLVDVGFGDSFTMPLEINHKNEQVQGIRSYSIKPFKDNSLMVWQKDFDGSMRSQYFFEPVAHQYPDEYLDGCLYHQTAPESRFTKSSIVSRLTNDGRITLEKDKLTITTNGIKSSVEISEDQWVDLLKKHFDIDL